MKDGVLIGIDAGTSVIKSIAFTTTGEQVAAEQGHGVVGAVAG